MFDGLLRFLTGVDDSRLSGEQDDATFALAVLLIEVARSDDRVEVRARGVIEMLWEVAYSDGLLTGDEDALIRRVAGLIYVSDWERGEAKRRITQRAEDDIARSGRR